MTYVLGSGQLSVSGTEQPTDTVAPTMDSTLQSILDGFNGYAASQTDQATQQSLGSSGSGVICVQAQGGTDANGNTLPAAAQCAAMPTLAGCANIAADFIHNPFGTISSTVTGAIQSIGSIFGL
jgi:hypothetical protein